MELELLKKVLTAQVLTLAEAIRMERMATNGFQRQSISLPIDDAIDQIRRQEQDIVTKLLARDGN